MIPATPLKVANGISSTDYYLKILTFESVEDIFGPGIFSTFKGHARTSMICFWIC